MEGQKLLTASQIRYLLTMKRLDGGGNGVRGAKVAAVLGFTNPSVHTMLNTFRDMNLIRKTAYGVAHFTDAGRKAVDRYSRYYEALFRATGLSFSLGCTPAGRRLCAACRAARGKPRRFLRGGGGRAVCMRQCGRPDGQRLPVSQDPKIFKRKGT